MSRTPFDPPLLHPETIERLAAIMRDHGLTEIKIHDDKARLHLVRAPATIAAPAAPVTYISSPAATPPAATPSAPAAEAPPPAGAVKSPMVGIAYLAPEPGATPYITLGAAVVAGQTVLLIEAMKTFNQIKAPHAGTVTQILVATGSPVEYDQALLVIA